ncbi:MAG: alpha/beta fold hydrolase [Deltaproteobacteria bacterium]|nr:alpha/beta fold hydrolase [Deltaproteobacteria bacterium]
MWGTVLKHLRGRDRQAVAYTDAEYLAAVAQIFSRAGRPFDRSRFGLRCIRSGNAVLQLTQIEVANPRGVVVFLPGTNAYSLLYAEVLTMWADAGYTVIGVDPRGHGRSSGARGSYTVRELLADATAALNDARERWSAPLFIGGSSQGAIVALYLATAQDDLAGAFCHNVADLADPRSVECTRSPRLFRYARWLLPLLGQTIPELPIPLSVYLDLQREPVSGFSSAVELLGLDPLLTPYVRAKTLAALAVAAPPRPLESLRTPVFVLHGARDQIFPATYVQHIFRRIGGPKQLHVVERGHHYTIIDDIPRYRDALLRWMDVQRAARGQRTILSRA